MPHVRARRLIDGWIPMVVAGIGAALCAGAVSGQPFGSDGLAKLTPGRTKAENALWIETPLTAQFKSSKHVVVASPKGPAVITMIHFAYPADENEKFFINCPAPSIGIRRSRTRSCRRCRRRRTARPPRRRRPGPIRKK